MIPGPYQYLVQPSPVDTREETRPSGLHVVRDQPEPERVYRGIILGVGTALKEEPWMCELGDVLYYLRGIKMGDSEFVLATYENILGWE